MRKTNTTTSEKVYSNRGYNSITAYSRFLVSGEFAHCMWLEEACVVLTFPLKAEGIPRLRADLAAPGRLSPPCSPSQSAYRIGQFLLDVPGSA